MTDFPNLLCTFVTETFFLLFIRAGSEILFGFVLFLIRVKSRDESLYKNNDKKTLLSSFVLN